MNTMIFSLRSRSGGAGALRGLAKNRRLRCNSFRWLSVDPIKTAPGGTASPGSLDPDAPPSLRVCFLGTDEVSVETLRVLLESCKGSGAHPGLVSHLEIVCPGDRPSGRGQLSLPVPVKSFAISNKLPFYEIPWGRRDIKSWRGWDTPSGPPSFDIGVVVSFGYFLHREMLERMKWGAVNMHPSLLPKYRGAAPIPHTILGGDTQTGVSIIDIDRTRFDAGRILLQQSTPVGPTETASQLTQRLATLGARSVLSVLSLLRSGNGVAPPGSIIQDERGASRAPKLRPEMGLLTWRDPERVTTARLMRITRAFDASFGAYTYFTFGKPVGRLKRVRLLQLGALPPPGATTAVSSSSSSSSTGDRGSGLGLPPFVVPPLCPPGSLLYNSQHQRLLLAGSDGWVEVLRLQVEAKQPVRGLDFANGHHIAADCSVVHRFVDEPPLPSPALAMATPGLA